MTAEPKDKSLYKYVKKLADKKFKSKTGVYKSSWIVKEYKRRGGLYKNKKNASKGLKRWYKEKWVDLNRPIKNSKGRIVGYKSCGRKSASVKSGRYPLCRPTRRVSPKTPRTLKQISKKSISKAKREKQRVKSRKNIKFGGDATGKNYEFHDLFVKSCKCENSKCKCDTKRESKKCIDNKCEVVKVPENKKQILESYYKQTGGMKMYKCKKCPYSANNKQDMKRHQIKHIGQKQYKCERCDYVSFRKEKIQLHKMKQHGGVWKTKERIKKGISSYRCPVCSRHFNRRDHTTRHMKVVHPQDELVKQMIDLDEWYKQSIKGDFEGIKQVGSGKKNPSPSKRKKKCPICFKELTGESSLNRHLKGVHKDDLTAQQILDLDKWYKQSIDDNFSGIRQVGSGKKQYFNFPSKKVSSHLPSKKVKCPVCFKEMMKHSLKPHMMRHKGEKPYKCDYPGCSYASSYNSDLKKHRGTHSRDEHYLYVKKPKKIDAYEYKSYLWCDFPGCGYATTSQDELKNHKLKHVIDKDNKQVGSGKKRSQYYGKRSSTMINIPENVKKTAKYAFKLKKLGFKGGIETGWKRAKQLATRDSIPIQDLKYMRAWFARHLYTSYPAYKKWKKAGRPKGSEWHNKRGIMAWIIWSGDAGFRWINSQKVRNALKKYYKKEFKPIIKKYKK